MRKKRNWKQDRNMLMINDLTCVNRMQMNWTETAVWNNFVNEFNRGFKKKKKVNTLHCIK